MQILIIIVMRVVFLYKRIYAKEWTEFEYDSLELIVTKFSLTVLAIAIILDYSWQKMKTLSTKTEQTRSRICVTIASVQDPVSQHSHILVQSKKTGGHRQQLIVLVCCQDRRFYSSNFVCDCFIFYFARLANQAVGDLINH